MVTAGGKTTIPTKIPATVNAIVFNSQQQFTGLSEYDAADKISKYLLHTHTHTLSTVLFLKVEKDE